MLLNYLAPWSFTDEVRVGDSRSLSWLMLLAGATSVAASDYDNALPPSSTLLALHQTLSGLQYC